MVNTMSCLKRSGTRSRLDEPWYVITFIVSEWTCLGSVRISVCLIFGGRQLPRDLALPSDDDCVKLENVLICRGFTPPSVFYRLDLLELEKRPFSTHMGGEYVLDFGTTINVEGEFPGMLSAHTSRDQQISASVVRVFPRPISCKNKY